MKAVILAGGLGKRLRPLTNERPKTMIEVCSVPIIGWQLDWLAKHDIRRVIISIGYLKQVVMDYVGTGGRFGVRVEYSEEDEPLGTGGALKTTRDLVGRENERFLMLYGDILTDLDPSLVVNDMKMNSDNALGSIVAIPLRSPFGIIDVEKGRARSFREKPILDDYLMNAGVYCLSRDIFDWLPSSGSFESITLPLLAKKDKLLVTMYLGSARWRSIDSHKDIDDAQVEFAELAPKIGVVV
jgi:mannose-1-phosphate guanylyltransferase